MDGSEPDEAVVVDDDVILMLVEEENRREKLCFPTFLCIPCIKTSNIAIVGGR